MPEHGTPESRMQQFDGLHRFAGQPHPADGDPSFIYSSLQDVYTVWWQMGSVLAAKYLSSDSDWSRPLPPTRYKQWRTDRREFESVPRVPNHPTADHSIEDRSGPLTVHTLVNAFLDRARTGQELSYYTRALGSWMIGRPRVPAGFHATVEKIVTASMEMDVANPFRISDSPMFEAVGADTSGKLSSKICRILAQVAMKVPVGQTTAILRHVPNRKEQAHDSLLRLNEHGLVPMDFWFADGVKGKLAMQYPTILEAALQRLDTPEGRDMLQKKRGKQAITIIKDYVDALLQEYASDETRDREGIAEIIRTIRSPRAGSIMAQLISIGKGVTKTINERLQEAGAEEADLLVQLDHTRTIQCAEALSRILGAIRLRSPKPEHAERQREIDSLHVSMLELLHLCLIGGEVGIPTIAELRLRYGKDAENVKDELMGGLPTGQSPVSVTSYVRARERLQESPVRAYDVNRPGYGLLS